MKPKLEEIFSDSPTFRIISFLISNEDRLLNKSQIIEDSKIGRNTFYKRINKLLALNIILEIGEDRTKLYKINNNHPLIKCLIDLRKKGII
jgi:hypothetical protein